MIERNIRIYKIDNGYIVMRENWPQKSYFAATTAEVVAKAQEYLDEEEPRHDVPMNLPRPSEELKILEGITTSLTKLAEKVQ